MSLPKPPQGAGPAGRRLWRAVQQDFEVSGADEEILRQAVTIADEIEALRPMITLGPFIKDKDGQPKPNPASVQHRHLSIVLARLLAAIQVVGQQTGEEHD